MQAEKVLTEKDCSSCGQSKQFTDFHVNSHSADGRRATCKACRSEARDSETRKRQREANKRFRQTERSREWNREYRRVPQERERQARERALHRERYRVRNKVNAAVRNGTLPWPGEIECAMCGGFAEEYHHEDYAKPLEVIALCVMCHKGLHSNAT